MLARGALVQASGHQQRDRVAMFRQTQQTQPWVGRLRLLVLVLVVGMSRRRRGPPRCPICGEGAGELLLAMCVDGLLDRWSLVSCVLCLLHRAYCVSICRAARRQHAAVESENISREHHT